MKDLPYITHDFGARNDPKLMDLQMDLGGQGLAIFWCLVEMLWENGGSIPANYRSIAFALRWCKPAEVEKVVTGYGLFQVEDGTITSRSATARIDAMRTRFDAASEQRRAAGRASGQARRRMGTERPLNENGTPVERPLNENGTPVEQLTNYLTNKQTNIDNNIPPEADFIYEIFLFRNLKNPFGEAQRFVQRYTDNGGTYADGTPVTDWEKAARGWNPEKQGRQYNDEALRWYQAVWNCARDRVPDARRIFIGELEDLRLKGQQLAIVYKTTQAAQAAGRFILDNDLAGDWKLDFRVAN